MNRVTRLSLAVLACSLTVAQGAGSPPQAKAPGLAVVDWIIIVAYALGTIVLGWYFSRRQRTTREYFTGSGKMPSLFIGVSLFATLLSTISYLSMPGEALGKGPAWMATLLCYPVIFWVVGYVLLPVYMRQRVTSAYELLEDRLGRETRLLGAIMFVLLRLVWMSLLIYLTAKALAIIIGVDAKWEPLIVLIAGFVAVIYTSMGGLRAVVITDFMQTILLYGGALLVIGTITVKMGGFGWFPTEWHANWDRQPIFSWDPSTRITVVGALLSVMCWHICTAGGDQVSVQRFMATENAKAARRSVATQLIVGVIVILTLSLAGFALLGYFETNPSLLPDGMLLKNDADKMFPHFIATGLPPVVSGLVVAAMFAAAMSSVDSGINSITAVVMTDMLGAKTGDGGDEERRFRQARHFAFVIGAIVVSGSSIMKYVPGNITAVTGKTANLLTAPIFGLFFFALFVPFAKPLGVWLGCAAGMLTAVLVAFSGPIFGVDPETGLDPISFQWIQPLALLVNLAVGLAVSWFLRENEANA